MAGYRLERWLTQEELSASPDHIHLSEASGSDRVSIISDGYLYLCLKGRRAHFLTQVVDAMITNSHLPRSSLLMLVSAFAGTERIRRAYEEAVARRYRFYSFGDGMLIL